ncbi:bacitracin resistance protein [Methanothermobacter thermautotrophicus str. Delta H]|uniref:Undecaprenyl-diphosphatase n=1 Tax=Methanothermobacter thermautotrophicus (strain ATCC 29096 / DSM 1053 / JCM 10044 / NBRC 100330 / Delta H) TaxID=187420 RepID=O27480_METTH|nr:bacitracin resistance protein [Methanothermobacter thermautotrophicus str. Delta H]
MITYKLKVMFMDVFQAIVIGTVQGLTEFLPVSSSGHLVLVPELMGVSSSLAFDTVLHVGTLVAVIGYFWNDIVHMLGAFLSSLRDIPQVDSGGESLRTPSRGLPGW